MQKGYLFSSLLFMVSCTSEIENSISDYILTEKDLIPEGAAFDKKTGTIYISSTYKRKIIAIDKNGNVRNFITEGQDDIKSVIGMEVDENTNSLWAISSEANDVLPLKDPAREQWRSSIYQYDLTDGKLLHKYVLNRDSVFLNDLTIGDDGTVYATESIQRCLYILRQGADSLSLFLRVDSSTQFLNGLSFTDKPGYLFVASTKGILKIDLATRRYFLLPENGPVKATDIDGLSFWDNYFIAHQSKAVTRFYLSPGRDSIIKADTLNAGKEFNSSTTGEVSTGYYYFIVNSQIKSGIDYVDKKIKPLDSFSNIIIRKLKL